MRKALAAAAAIGVSACGVFVRHAAGAPVPIHEYTFESLVPATTGDTPSTGSSTAAVTMRSGAGAAADRRLASAGPKGAGDSVFDNTQSNLWGSAATSNAAGRADRADDAAVDALQSFTLQGWYKADGPANSSARLLSNIGNGNTRGFEFGVASANRFRLSVNVNLVPASGTFVDSSVNANYGLNGQWVFTAVTYDGTAATNNVKFYVGTLVSPVTLVSTHTLAAGAVLDDDGAFAIGNVAGGTRPFDALIDDVRVFGSQADASGVLTLAELESIRALDVPEPASLALAAAAALPLLTRRGRRRA